MDATDSHFPKLLELNVIQLVAKLNNGDIKLFKVCKYCYTCLESGDISHICEESDFEEENSD